MIPASRCEKKALFHHKTQRPTSATITAKRLPFKTVSVFPPIGLAEFFEPSPPLPWMKPVDAAPEAVPEALDPVPEPPLPEPLPEPEEVELDPVSLLPRPPFWPVPTPERPGMVATSLELEELLEVVLEPAVRLVPVPKKDLSTVLLLVTSTDRLVMLGSVKV